MYQVSMLTSTHWRRFWFLIDFKDRLMDMLIALEQTSEKLDRRALPTPRFCVHAALAFAGGAHHHPAWRTT